jgi:hypothetical protein
MEGESQPTEAHVAAKVNKVSRPGYNQLANISKSMHEVVSVSVH